MKYLNTKYRQLIEHLNENASDYYEEEMVVFTSAKGKTYSGELMIIGRAVNDWRNYFNKNDVSSKDNVLKEIEESIEKDNLDWVSEKWGNNESGYNTKKSAFWRVTHDLASELVQNKKNPIDSIVYSNLYKVAKSGGKNPSERLCDCQFDYCCEILSEEINQYKPNIIVFLTDINWAGDFLEKLKVKNLINSANNHVKFIGKYNSSKIIVVPHPQGKPEKEIVDEILSQVTTIS